MQEDYKQTLRQVGRFMSLGIAIVLCLVIGLTIGYYVDKWFGTKPFFTILFIFLGICAGFLTLYREVKLYLKQD